MTNPDQIPVEVPLALDPAAQEFATDVANTVQTGGDLIDERFSWLNRWSLAGPATLVATSVATAVEAAHNTPAATLVAGVVGTAGALVEWAWNADSEYGPRKEKLHDLSELRRQCDVAVEFLKNRETGELELHWSVPQEAELSAEDRVRSLEVLLSLAETTDTRVTVPFDRVRDLLPRNIDDRAQERSTWFEDLKGVKVDDTQETGKVLTIDRTELELATGNAQREVRRSTDSHDDLGALMDILAHANPDHPALRFYDPDQPGKLDTTLTHIVRDRLSELDGVAVRRNGHEKAYVSPNGLTQAPSQQIRPHADSSGEASTPYLRKPDGSGEADVTDLKERVFTSGRAAVTREGRVIRRYQAMSDGMPEGVEDLLKNMKWTPKKLQEILEHNDRFSPREVTKACEIAILLTLEGHPVLSENPAQEQNKQIKTPQSGLALSLQERVTKRFRLQRSGISLRPLRRHRAAKSMAMLGLSVGIGLGIGHNTEEMGSWVPDFDSDNDSGLIHDGVSKDPLSSWSGVGNSGNNHDPVFSLELLEGADPTGYWITTTSNTLIQGQDAGDEMHWYAKGMHGGNEPALHPLRSPEDLDEDQELIHVSITMPGEDLVPLSGIDAPSNGCNPQVQLCTETQEAKALPSFPILEGSSLVSAKVQDQSEGLFAATLNDGRQRIVAPGDLIRDLPGGNVTIEYWLLPDAGRTVQARGEVVVKPEYRTNDHINYLPELEELWEEHFGEPLPADPVERRQRQEALLQQRFDYNVEPFPEGTQINEPDELVRATFREGEVVCNTTAAIMALYNPGLNQASGFLYSETSLPENDDPADNQTALYNHQRHAWTIDESGRIIDATPAGLLPPPETNRPDILNRLAAALALASAGALALGTRHEAAKLVRRQYIRRLSDAELDLACRMLFHSEYTPPQDEFQTPANADSQRERPAALSELKTYAHSPRYDQIRQRLTDRERHGSRDNRANIRLARRVLSASRS